MFNFHRRRNRRKEAPLPAKELRIHQRYVLRLNSYQHWQKRILILTKDDLLVGIEGHDFVIERIPLNEVSAVNKLVYDPVTGSIRKPTEDEEQQPSSRSGSFRPSASLRSFSIRGRNQEAAKGSSQITAFNIETVPYGLSNGATFSFRTEHPKNCSQWVEQIRKAAASAPKPPHAVTLRSRVQGPLLRLSESTAFKHCSALLIILNFAINIVQHELLPPPGTDLAVRFEQTDKAFTLVFVVELLVNMTARGLWGYFTSSWSVFDFVTIFGAVLLWVRVRVGRCSAIRSTANAVISYMSGFDSRAAVCRCSAIRLDLPTR